MLTCDMLGTLTVFLMKGLLPLRLEAAVEARFFLLLALISSLMATDWRNLSRVRMVSTAETPLVYFSMKVSPSGPVASSCPEAAITASDCLSSSSSLACNVNRCRCLDSQNMLGDGFFLCISPLATLFFCGERHPHGMTTHLV